MKINLIFIKSIMVASLIFCNLSLAEETPKEAIESNGTEEECGVDLLQLPKTKPNSDIRYLSGGTCIDSVTQIKNLAKTYPLEVVLVQKTDDYDKESYIADVLVKITDGRDQVILTVVTEGPYLLVDLPDGHYQIMGDFNGVSKARKVTIKKNQHSRIVLLWDNRTQGETENDT